MQVAFYLAGEITQVLDAIPWVRCASGNVCLLTTKIAHATFCENLAETFEPDHNRLLAGPNLTVIKSQAECYF